MKHRFIQLCSIFLTVVLLVGLLPVRAATSDSNTRLTWEKAEATSEVSFTGAASEEAAETCPYADTDIVRVSIVLPQDSVLNAGWSMDRLTGSSSAQRYRNRLLREQEALAAEISDTVLDGDDLDIVWNITLSGNIISANVEYGDIAAISDLDGVASVEIESAYSPAVYQTEENDPSMATSGEMIGTYTVWDSGYTGAGTRIAIIDTGIDTDHQSFDEGAFLYALGTNAPAGETDSYLESLNLLDLEELEVVWDSLHIAALCPSFSAEDAYFSAKIPFALNYIDRDTDVTHDNDSATAHGSHVAGIAAANRYIPVEDEGSVTYQDALETVLTQGAAPDAQIIVMKVFGKNGGAYSSDMIAAIEDAILLGCDAVNLSLGSGYTGFSEDSVYWDAYKALTDSEKNPKTVVAAAAGNNGSWAKDTVPTMLFADDVDFSNVADPSSLSSLLSVASVNNDGSTFTSFQVNGDTYFYLDASNGVNQPFSSLGDAVYDAVYLTSYGTAETFSAAQQALTERSDSLSGKIVFVNRGGGQTFTDMADRAASYGAAALVIVNSFNSMLQMGTDGSTAELPVVSVSSSSGTAIRNQFQAVSSGGETLYYIGNVTTCKKLSQVSYHSSYYTMSSFSSWGTVSSLELKPEITAPGGYIYSVNGLDPSGTAYMTNSGTSMATPQICGMSALCSEYLDASGISSSVLSHRALVQSLLMSTAKPMQNAYGNYYSVLQQGSGLADISSAVSADSYLIMDEAATDSWNDGKIKVELGDDPNRDNRYSFSFTVCNLTDTASDYNLSASFFTQGIAAGYDVANWDYEVNYLTEETVPLDCSVTWSGETVSGSTLTVPAGGSATVTCTFSISSVDILTYDQNGFYIEGYAFAQESAGTTLHSIPILGYYGSWTEPSMFDRGSHTAYVSGDCLETPYMFAAVLTESYDLNSLLVSYDGTLSEKYCFGGNPVCTDSTYFSERNALSSSAILLKASGSAIRNASAKKLSITKDGTDVYTDVGGTVFSAYNINSTWKSYAFSMPISYSLADSTEGETYCVTLSLAPEYYLTEQGVAWDELGAGASKSISFTIDNTAPELITCSLSEDEKTLTVRASDNRYTAGVLLYTANGTGLLAQAGAAQESVAAGATLDYELDVSSVNGEKFTLTLVDYAGNRSDYTLHMEIGSPAAAPEMMFYDASTYTWVDCGDSSDLTEAGVLAETEFYFAATEADGYLYAATADGTLDVLSLTNPSDRITVCKLDFIPTDLCYDGTWLYGICDRIIYRIDRLTGESEEMLEFPVNVNTLACDRSGNFYSVRYGTGEILSYRLSRNVNSPDLHFDYNGDGSVNETDVQVLLDYAVGKRKTLPSDTEPDWDGDGDVDTEDAWLFSRRLTQTACMKGISLVCETDQGNNYLQALEADPDTGLLYWAVCYYSDPTSYTAELMEINPADGTSMLTAVYSDCSFHEMTCLVIPSSQPDSSWVQDAVQQVELCDAIHLFPGSSCTLQANVLPWSADDRSVIWESSDPSVVSVNQSGLVNANAEGTAVITATSVENKEATARCTVTVQAISVVFEGVQTYEENSSLATWNLSAKNAPQLETDLTACAYAATQSDTRLVMYDPSSGLSILYDIASGTYQTAAASFPVTDMTVCASDRSKIHAVSGCCLYINQDPLHYTAYGFNLQETLDAVGALQFTGIASAGIVGGAERIFLTDDAGNIWLVSLSKSNGAYQLTCRVFRSDLTESGYSCHYNMNTDSMIPLCSLCYDASSGLYFTASDGTNFITYYLEYLSSDGSFLSSAIASFDSATRYITLTEIQSETASSASTFLRTLIVRDAASQTNPGAAAMSSMIGCKSFVAEPLDASEDEPEIRENETQIYLYAQDTEGTKIDSTNGLFEISWDSSDLRLCSVSAAGATYISRCNDGTQHVLIGYVAEETIPAGNPAATLIFSGTGSTQEKISVRCLEQNGSDRSDGIRILPPAPGYRLSAEQIAGAVSAGEKQEEETTTLRPSETFADTSGDAWYAAGLDYAVSAGLMKGVSEERFAPDNATTRAMMVTVLYRLSGEPAVSDSIPFTDVPDGAWYREALCWAYQNGIASGYADGTFGAGDTLTRQQMICFLYRYAKFCGADVSATTSLDAFSDAGSVAGYAKEAMQWAVASGLIQGSGGKLNPNAHASRAQFAVMLQRFSALCSPD